ncbi:hypothetical protein HDU80_000823 [Chytriomyces hyalinus]|nr:hypothetical protein HDU80_000823 [Chytriomyces hyalinus]
MKRKTDIEAGLPLPSSAVLAGAEATTETAATRNPAGSGASVGPFGLYHRCAGPYLIFAFCIKFLDRLPCVLASFKFLEQLTCVQAHGICLAVSAVIVRALKAVGIEGAPLTHLAGCFYSLCFDGMSSIFRALQMGAVLFAVIVRAYVVLRTNYASPQPQPISLPQQYAVVPKSHDILQQLYAVCFLVAFLAVTYIVMSCFLYFGSKQQFVDLVALVMSVAVCSDTFKVLRIGARWPQPVKLVTLLPVEPKSEKLLQPVVEELV